MEECRKTIDKIRSVIVVPFALILIEAAFLLYAASRGKADLYLKAAVPMYLVLLVIYIFAGIIGANERIVIWTSLLLTIGMFMQILLIRQTGDEKNAAAAELVRNLFLGLGAAVLMAVFMLAVYGHYYDAMIKILIILNFVLVLVMLAFGGGVTGDGSRINLLGVQPLELVKLCYLFVLAGLLCKPERRNRRLWGLRRSVLAILYMLVNAACFLLLKELGTLLILTCTGLCFLFIFCEERKDFMMALLFHAAAALAGTFLAVFKITEVGRRLNSRFLYFLDPSKDAYGEGFQYIQMKKALAVSGWFGADAPRYKFHMAAEKNDVVFARLIQVSGLLLAAVVIACYILLLLEGYKAACRSSDLYYRGLAMGISIMLAFQGIVHIACNVGMFPITGVPLLFISKGGSNQMVSLIITALLLIISTKGMKRAESDENEFEEEKDYGRKIQKFFR